MIAKFNPSGTHIHNGSLKIRFDFYPEISDKAYSIHLLKNKEVNPCLCYFLNVPENVTQEWVAQYFNRNFDKNSVATIDDILTKSNRAHLLSVFAKSKKCVQAKVSTKNLSALIDNINILFSTSYILFDSGGKALEIKSESIDIGSGATDRTSTIASGYTLLDKNNPANADGKITMFEFWFNTNASGVKVGTFYHETENILYSRDFEIIGNVASGSVQSFLGLDCDVKTDDHAALYYSGGSLERDTTGGLGFFYLSGDFFDGLEHGFITGAGAFLSIYGTGSESIVSVGRSYGLIF